MNVKIYRSIAEVNEGAWDAIVNKNGIICSHRYIELLEKSGISEGRCYYPVLYNGDEIIAHTCAYLANTEIDIFARGAIKKTVELIRGLWKGFFTLRYLECGSPTAFGNPVSFKDGVDRAEAMRFLCNSIEGLAKELGVRLIVFRDFYDAETELRDIFKRSGYMNIHNLPKAEIKVRWKSFDEYLGSMRSGYRCKIIKNMKKGAGVDTAVHELKDFSRLYGHDLKRLHDNTSNRAKEAKREPLTEAFFQNLDRYLEGKAVVVLSLKGSKPIGFMMLLLNDKELVSSVIGMDYDHNEEYCIYFNLFYKTVEFGIKNGMERIGMGITTLEPKKDMGSSIINLNMYMKHFNPFLNKVIPILFDMITPPDTTGPRNVFKEKP